MPHDHGHHQQIPQNLQRRPAARIDRSVRPARWAAWVVVWAAVWAAAVWAVAWAAAAWAAVWVGGMGGAMGGGGIGRWWWRCHARSDGHDDARPTDHGPHRDPTRGSTSLICPWVAWVAWAVAWAVAWVVAAWVVAAWVVAACDPSPRPDSHRPRSSRARRGNFH